MLSFFEEILLESNKVISSKHKSLSKKSSSQFVTDTDIAIEEFLVSKIRNKYPDSGVISEEKGKIESKDRTYFIVDPLDGTSNFINELGWYGVMICFYSNNQIQYSGIYLPETRELFLAGLGKGATKNGKKIFNNNSRVVEESLVSYCVDKTEENYSIDFKKKLYGKLLSNFLNVRSTNSAVDYVYTCEGKLSLINLDNKIWDIAPLSLIATESGNIVSSTEGNKIEFDLNDISKSYPIVVADKVKSKLILKLINEIR